MIDQLTLLVETIFTIMNKFLTILSCVYMNQPPRINGIPRIITHVGINIHATLEADGVGLDKTTQLGAIVPNPIVQANSKMFFSSISSSGSKCNPRNIAI